MSMKLFGVGVEKKAGALSLKQGRNPDRALARLCQTVIRPRVSLLSEVKQLDDALLKTAKADSVCQRLMTVPGVGPLTALAFKAAVDDPARFRSSRAVGAYFGLTPRRRQSGQMDVSGHISRMGDETVRTALYSAAFVLLTVSKSKCPLRLWGLRLKEEKGLKLAAVAVARKMAVIMHRMWVTERDFDPTERSSGRRA
jgi:transposase